MKRSMRPGTMISPLPAIIVSCGSSIENSNLITVAWVGTICSDPATDWIGVKSGRDYDKWKETGLTPVAGVAVSCPHIAESPVSIECRVKTVMPLGSHDMFIAEVVNVLAKESLFDPETDAFMLEKAGLINYTHGHYYTQGEPLGRFGFSVMKKKKNH